MYICNNCGRTFEEPATGREEHPYGEGTASEIISSCPYCRDYDYEDAVECEHCGKRISHSESDFGLCDDCRIGIAVRVRKFFDGYQDNEKDYIFDRVLEGI